MSPFSIVTPSMGSISFRSIATIWEPSTLHLFYKILNFLKFSNFLNLWEQTWLQLPGAAHKSTTFLTPSKILNS